MSATNLYDAEFYAARRPLLPEYQAMARVLHSVFQPTRCLDIGCGPGEILATMRAEFGTRCVGIDSSPAAHCMPGPAYLGADITESSMLIADADLVICTEVAEHIPVAKADALVAFVARNTSKWLVWSAATPGQGGTGHINEQPCDYWCEKMNARGLDYRPQLTQALRLLLAISAPKQPWYGKTTMVFEKPAMSRR